MNVSEHIHPQYIIDENGTKKSVIISLEEYQELMEDLSDIAVVAERKDEEAVPLAQVVRELEENGTV